jgi:uncharacterized protein YlzI (FlbEa/FlbD family)
MIKLSRLDRQEIAINCDLIAWIEARPDTIVRMMAGESIPVREGVDEVIRRIAEYRSTVLRLAGLDALVARASGAAAPPAPPRDDGSEDERGVLAELEVSR